MKRVTVFCFLFALVLIPFVLEAQMKGKALDALAKKLVNDCASIKAGELVIVTGGVRDMELLEDLAVHSRRNGAFPLITIGSDRLTRRMIVDVPAKYDSLVHAFDMKLANSANVVLSVEFGESEGLLADIPPERFAVRGKAAQPINEAMRQSKVRGVNLGNALYPTSMLAKRYGISQKQLSKIFWDGVNIDYRKLLKTGDAIKKILENGSEARITTASGTNLRLSIARQQVFVSDGVISEEDMSRGPGGYNVWLPAGEAYLSVLPGSAEGKIVVDRQFYEGKEIRGLTMTVSGGKVTSITAKSGAKRLKAMYDAAGERKDELSYLDIGINPNVIIPKNSRMVAWMASGMVTVGVGNNSFTGGDNNSDFGLAMFLSGATLAIDGTTVVEKGRLKL